MWFTDSKEGETESYMEAFHMDGDFIVTSVQEVVYSWGVNACTEILILYILCGGLGGIMKINMIMRCSILIMNYMKNDGIVINILKIKSV